jgi:flagellar basal body-associated protein FliL
MLKRIAKGLVQIVIAMVVLVVAINGYAAWTASPVKQYCSELKPGMSFEVAVSLAKKYDLFTPFVNQDTADQLIVLNQKAPVFRYACKATFVDGKFSSATSYGAD